MQRYFCHICDGTDVQADWRSCTYGRGSQRHRHFAGFFNVPVLHRHGTSLFIRWFRHTFYDTLGIRKTYSRLKPPASSRDCARDLSAQIQGKSDEHKVRQLVLTIVATMSDQGATNPVFNRHLLVYKDIIMLHVVENWARWCELVV